MTDNLAKIREDLQDARDALGTANPSSYNQLKDAVVTGLDYVEQALALLDSLSAPDAKEGQGWIQGEPPSPWNTEWFFAKLKNGTYAVLCRLPEEYSYDYKTADETYYKKDWVIGWMPIPETEFMRPQPAAPAPEPVIDDGRTVAQFIKDTINVPEPAPEPFVSKENPTTHLIEILPNPDYEYITAPEPEGEELKLTNIGLARLICNDVTKFISIGRDSEGDPCGWDFATEKAAQHVQTILDARLSPPSPKSWAEDRERRIYAGEVLLDVPTVKESLTVPAPEPKGEDIFDAIARKIDASGYLVCEADWPRVAHIIREARLSPPSPKEMPMAMLKAMFEMIYYRKEITPTIQAALTMVADEFGFTVKE